MELKFNKSRISSLASIAIENFKAIPILQNSPIPIPQVKLLVDDYYDKWYAEVERLRGLNPVPDKVFLGNNFCRKCHQDEYEAWTQTSHASAFTSLKKYEKRCIPCHTTGFGYPTGYWDISTTPNFAGVGCEECHVVPKNPRIQGMHQVEPVSEAGCRCHVPPHDYDFDYKKEIIKVDHE